MKIIMKTKTVLSYLAFFGGLALLISCLCIWRGETTADNIFYLNLVVSCAAYSLFFGNLLLSKQSDNSDKAGSWGIKWTAIILYPVAAITAIIFLAPYAFLVQLMVHLGLGLLLLIVFVAVLGITAKVRSVATEQKVTREGIQAMKRAMSSVQDALLDNPDVPANFRHKVEEIEQALRYLSPSDSAEAADLEDRFVETATDIQIGLSAFDMNRERLEMLIQKLDRLHNQRKHTYSN